MLEVKPCPVCGRTPKVKYYYDQDIASVKCKPLFEKAHLEANVYCSYSSYKYQAIELWNKKVDEYTKVRS